MATVSIYFDKRGCASGVFSVKWLVTHQRKQRLFATGLLLEEEGVKFLKQYAGGLKGTVKDQDGYFGEVDHLIPWQIDHLISWRPKAKNAVEAGSKLVNKKCFYW